MPDADNLAELQASLSKGPAANYPAPQKALEVIKQNLNLNLNLNSVEALKLEPAAFMSLGLEDASHALVGIFLSDQLVMRKAKSWANKSDKEAEKTAVLGGDIAYQSSLKGVPIVIKDIT